MTRLGQLHEAAAPWLTRLQGGLGPRPVVDSRDRADRAVLGAISTECTALAELEADLAVQYGAAGLTGDVWMAAYARDPQLADAEEVQPCQRVNRTIVAAMLGSPEHTELRRSTVGEPYAAAMAVLAAGPALRRMLAQLDGETGRQKAAHDAHQAVARAAAMVGRTYRSAAGSVDEDPDAEVDALHSGDVRRAVARAETADAEAQAADAALAGQTGGDMAVALVRATARQSAADADADLAAEEAAMTAWGIEEGQRQRLDADERMRLAAKLRGGKLARWAELIGRFRQMATAQRSRRVEHARGEYVGVTIGDDLGSLVGGELATLAIPALRAQFAIRYADRQLMVYDQRGEDHEAQGAIIACIDCSYSMTDTDEHGISGEAYAKALALALLDQAREAKPPREFAAILFDSDVEPPIRFPADQPVSLESKLQLAENFPGGGTDFQAPLDEAVGLLAAEYNTNGRGKADIVLVTDGTAEVDDTWLADWRAAKKRLGFRCFGLSIGAWADPARSLEAICDDVRHIDDLADTHATADLFRAI